MRRPRTGRRAEADPRRAHDEVDERRHREGRALEHLPAVEERERDAEGEEHEQIERHDGEWTAQVDQAEQEDGREPEPDGPRGEKLPPESAGTAARHLPRDLRARPGLGHRPVEVPHDALGHLAGVARPDVDRPGSRLAVERRVGLRARRVAVEPARDLGIGQEGLDRLALGEPGRSGGGRERRLDQTSLLVVDRCRGCRRGSRTPAGEEREHGDGGRDLGRGSRQDVHTPLVISAAVTERPQLVADEVDRRDQHDRERL